MRIYNGTPHPVNIIDGATLDSDDRKYKGGHLVNSIPSTGMLSVTFAVTEGEPVEGIPTFHKVVTGLDPLPEGYDLYIVSALYGLEAVKVHGQGRLYGVADPVMSEDGKTFVGCRGLQLF